MTKSPSENLDEQKIIAYAMSYINDMTEEMLSEIHGKKSIDYVLGYQKCAQDMKDLAEGMMDVLRDEGFKP